MSDLSFIKEIINVKAQKNNMQNNKRACLGQVVPLSTPYVVVIEPSGYCNLKCVFCPINDEKYSNALKKSFMDKEIFLKIINDLKQFTERIKIIRLIGNGEPLLNSNIIEMVKIIKDSNVAEMVEITTNGTLLNENISLGLIDAGLDILKISVEALTKIEFKKIAKYEIDIEKYRKNIEFFYNNKKQCQVYIKINNLAIKNKEEEKVFFNYYGDYADNIFIENISPVWPEFDDGLKIEYESTRFGETVKKRNVCSHIFKSIMICADGEILPCCADWQRKLLLGNIKNDSILDIWKGYKLESLQKAFLNNKRMKIVPCNECLYNEYCDPDILDGYEKEILNRMEKKLL